MHLGLKIKNLGGVIPEWKNLSDAGLDLHASVDMVIIPGARVLVPLGFATEFPNTYVAIIKDRSGLALGPRISTHGGVIDSGYRGEWKVILSNNTDDSYFHFHEGSNYNVEEDDTPYQTDAVDFVIKRGERIAQVIFLPVFHLHIEEVTKLGDSIRGSGGFGSTGN